jgi:hypothetical protein
MGPRYTILYFYRHGKAAPGFTTAPPADYDYAEAHAHGSAVVRLFVGCIGYRLVPVGGR